MINSARKQSPEKHTTAIDNFVCDAKGIMYEAADLLEMDEDELNIILKEISLAKRMEWKEFIECKTKKEIALIKQNADIRQVLIETRVGIEDASTYSDMKAWQREKKGESDTRQSDVHDKSSATDEEIDFSNLM